VDRIHPECDSLAVPGIGASPADIMFVGEALGATEEMVGEPFVGRAGKRLDAILSGCLHLQRHEVFITNVVKHRPEGNRNPYAAEVRACIPYLWEEIEVVKPNIIITLGAIPLKYVGWEGLKLKNTHGRPYHFPKNHRLEGKILMPWYHPAASFHNPKLYEILIEDANEFWNRIATMDDEKPRLNYKLVDEYRIFDYSSRVVGTPIGFDIETNVVNVDGSLQPNLLDIVGFSVSTKPYEAMYTANDIGWMRGVLEQGHGMWPKICHNVKFEYRVLKRAGIILKDFEDTKGMAYVLGYQSTHLKDLARQLLGVETVGYKDLNIPKDADIDTHRKIHEENYRYGAADADNTRQIYFILKKELEEEGVYHIYKDIELPLTPVLAEMEDIGIGINEEECRLVICDLQRDAEESRQRVLGILGERKINLNSREQLSKALETLGAPITKRTAKKNLLKTDEITLEGIRDWNPELISALLSRAKWEKLSSFPKGFLKKRVDGRIHPTFNQYGHWEEDSSDSKNAPITGRLSCSGPNLQQVPKHSDPYWGSRIRSCIIPREGNVFLVADFEQQELRIAAVVADDKRLIEDLAGDDVYATIGGVIYGRRIDKGSEERFNAKTFTLGWMYGGGWKKLREVDPTLTEQLSKAGFDRLSSLYPNISNFHRDTSKSVRELGYSSTLFGRKRWFPEIFDRGGGKRVLAKAERMATNHRIQGTAADAIKIAMRKLYNFIHDKGLDARLVIQVHDELVVDCPNSEVDIIIHFIKDMATGLVPGIDLPVEFKVGENWGNGLKDVL